MFTSGPTFQAPGHLHQRQHLHGTTFVGAGTTLQLGDGTTNGSISGSIVDNAILLYLQNAPQSFNNTITGSGQVASGNGNEITLPGASSSLALQDVQT